MITDCRKIPYGSLVTCILNAGPVTVRHEDSCRIVDFSTNDIDIGDSLMLDDAIESVFEPYRLPIVTHIKEGLQVACVVKSMPRLVSMPPDGVCEDWVKMLNNEWYLICVCEFVKSVHVENGRYIIDIGW